MIDIKTYDKLEEFGRMRLSPSFFMRDFLHSEIAGWHQLRNVPDHLDAAIAMGKALCSQLLEPLQLNFGRIHVRSGYRSPSVNDFGNKNRLNCAATRPIMPPTSGTTPTTRDFTGPPRASSFPGVNSN